MLNNPVKYNDPTGHFWQFIVGAAIALFASTFDNPMIRTVGMVIGSIMMGFGAGEIFSGMASMEAAVASGATVSFSSNMIATGDLGTALQAGVLGGLSAGITYGVAHGGHSPFNSSSGSLRGALHLAHGVVQGGFNELRGGSFRQGFINGTIGKLGGSVVHENFQQNQVAQVGGIVAVSGIAAVASGANSRDAVLRSAISVITVYLYNELGGTKIFDQDKRGRWTAVSDIERDTLKRNRPLHANGILASQAAPGQSVSAYLETTPEETAKIGAGVLSNMAIGVGALNPVSGTVMAIGAWGLDPSWSNFIGMMTGPTGKVGGVVDDAIYYGTPVLKQTVDNVGTVNNAVSVGCNTVVKCD